MVRRAQQTLLGIARPKQTLAQLRFEQETIRRGGPIEVAGKRFRGIAQQRRQHEESKFEGPIPGIVLPTLKRMPR